MKKYSVYDNGRPCSGLGFPGLEKEGWKNHSHPSYKEALEYARRWLDFQGDAGSLDISLNEMVEYNGYGDVIQIREEEI